MSKKEKISIGVGILLFLALIAWVVKSIPEPPQPKEESTHTPRVMSYAGNSLSEEKDGRKQWELHADTISMDVDTQDAELEHVTGQFYSADGRVVTLVAKHGTYKQSTKDIAVDGDVKVTNTDGAELTSQKLTWIAAREMLVAEVDVHVKKDDMRASGDRIETSDGFNHFRIIGKAHIERGVKDEGK